MVDLLGMLPAGATEWGSCIQQGALPRLLPSTRDLLKGDTLSPHIHRGHARYSHSDNLRVCPTFNPSRMGHATAKNILLFVGAALFVCRRARTRAGLEFHAKKQNFVASPLLRCSATAASSSARLELDPCEFQI